MQDVAMGRSISELFSAARRALSDLLDAQDAFQEILTRSPDEMRDNYRRLGDATFNFAHKYHDRYHAMDAAEVRAVFALTEIGASKDGPTYNLFSDEEDGLVNYAGVEAKNLPEWVLLRTEPLREVYLTRELREKAFPRKRSVFETASDTCKLPEEHNRERINRRLDEVFRLVKKKVIEARTPTDDHPNWDADRCNLWIGGRFARKVKRTAGWIKILDVFQEHGWPPRIDNPLPPGANLAEAVRQLNKGLHGMRFECDGSGGEGIIWRLVPAE